MRVLAKLWNLAVFLLFLFASLYSCKSMVKLSETLVLARSRASDLDNVRKLNCWGSNLTDVRILRKLPNVQVLSLSVNNISSLVDFSFCKNLEEIYIRKNDIQDLREVCHLKDLPKLTKLWLADNPCASIPSYRLTILKVLPNLQKLDNISVTEDDVNEAMDKGEELEAPPIQDEPENDLETSQDAEGDPAAGIVVKSLQLGPPSHMTDEASGRNPGPLPREHKVRHSSPLLLSLGETNEIRKELGLKPLPVDKVSPLKPRRTNSQVERNTNILRSVLLLIKELDEDSLMVVNNAVRSRLEDF